MRYKPKTVLKCKKCGKKILVGTSFLKSSTYRGLYKEVQRVDSLLVIVICNNCK